MRLLRHRADLPSAPICISPLLDMIAAGTRQPMKHIVVGGDGFVGRHLAADLRAMGEQVVVADVDRSDLDIYRSVPFIEMDIVDRRALDRLPLEPEDVVYNMSAKMLSPIMPKAKRHDFFFPVNTDGVRNLLEFMSTRGANSSRAVLDRHDLRSHQGAAGQTKIIRPCRSANMG